MVKIISFITWIVTRELQNKTNINRIKEKYVETVETRMNSEMVVEEQAERKLLRSNCEVYNRIFCVICQEEEEGKLCQVECKETGKRMLEVAKMLQDKSFLLRLNSIPNANDAVANEVRYHLPCWVKAKREAARTDNTQVDDAVNDDTSQVLADIEIINGVDLHLKTYPDDVLDMSIVNEWYNEFIGTECNNKRYLKQLLTENVPDIHFIRPPARNMPERICSSFSQSKAVESLRNNRDNYTFIFDAAKIIREDILKCEEWQFDGLFDGFHLPLTLQSLLRWIIVGPKDKFRSNDIKEHAIDKSIQNIGQILMSTTKTKRQVQYASQKNSQRKFHNSKEIPFTVGLAIHIHKETRCKTLINDLSDLNLCISYEKLMNIETDIATSVATEMKENGGIHIPSNIVKGRRIHFAVDNTDFKNDTADGKNEFHGTGMTVFQTSIDDCPTQRIKIKRSQNATMKFKEVPFIQQKECFKPNPPTESFPTLEGIVSKDLLNLYKEKDKE